MLSEMGQRYLAAVCHEKANVLWFRLRSSS